VNDLKSMVFWIIWSRITKGKNILTYHKWMEIKLFDYRQDLINSILR